MSQKNAEKNNQIMFCLDDDLMSKINNAIDKTKLNKSNVIRSLLIKALKDFEVTGNLF